MMKSFFCCCAIIAALIKDRILPEVVLSVRSAPSTSVRRGFHGLLSDHGSDGGVFGRCRIGKGGVDELDICCSRLTFHGGVFHGNADGMGRGMRDMMDGTISSSQSGMGQLVLGAFTHHAVGGASSRGICG